MRCTKTDTLVAIVLVGLVTATSTGRAIRAQDEVQTVAQNMPGFKAQMSYENLGDGETVNVSNGGLIITHASAIGLPGNMGAELRPVRVYNSKSTIDGFEDYVDCSQWTERVYGPLGFGWRIGFGRVHMRTFERVAGSNQSAPAAGSMSFYEYSYEDESGAEHHLFPLGGHTYDIETQTPAPTWYVTNDGSYIRAKFQPSIHQWVLYFPDGSVRRAGDPVQNGFIAPQVTFLDSTSPYPNSPPMPVVLNPFTHGWYVTSVRDRAGNETLIRYSPFDPNGLAGTPLSGAVERIRDSFGRRLLFQYGVTEAVPDATFLLHKIQQLPPETAGEGVLREETFSYEQVDDCSVPCGQTDVPVLQSATAPAGLMTLYGYCSTPSPFTAGVLLNAIYYPTGAVSSYEWENYHYYKARSWYRLVLEEPVDHMAHGVGVHRRTVEHRPEASATARSRLTWTWERSITAHLYLFSFDPTYDFPTHPVITVDPMGTEEVYYFAEDDRADAFLPPGTEILKVRRRPGTLALVPGAINSMPDPSTFDVWDAVLSWTYKQYESGDLFQSLHHWGDSHRCTNPGWPGQNTLAPFGNIRPYKVIQGERDASGATLWKKEVLSTDWNGFGQYRRTTTTDLSPQPGPHKHCIGSSYAFPDDFPDFAEHIHHWTEEEITYQTDLVTLTYSGTLAADGVPAQYRVDLFTRDTGTATNTGLIIAQRSLRNVQSNPTNPNIDNRDRQLAIAHTSQGNISGLTYSGGDGGATYLFHFAWDHGQVSQMSRGPETAPFVEFTRAIDPDTSQILAQADPNQLTTSFQYDALNRLTRITPPNANNGERSTYISYPTDSTTAGGKTWTTSHDILYYRGPERALPGEMALFTESAWLVDTDSGATYQHHIFDDLGRLVKTRALHPGGYLVETMTAYDPLGNAFFTSLPYKLDESPTMGSLNWASKLAVCGDSFVSTIPLNPGDLTPYQPYGSVSSFFVDAVWPASSTTMSLLINGAREPFDRPVRTFKPDGNKTETTYNGLDHSVTHFGIRTGEGTTIDSTTWYRKDIWGRLKQVEPALGTKARYTYNGLDQLTQVELKENLTSDRVGQLRTFTYDALGRILSAHNPESGTTHYQGYDCIGNLLAMQDANGQDASSGKTPYTLKNEYDALGRLTATKKVDASTGATLQTLIENTYDSLFGYDLGPSAGKMVQSKSRQNLFDYLEGESHHYREVESAVRISYQPLTGRIKTVTQSSTAGGGPEENSITYAYDLYGQVAEQTLPGGTVLTNGYSHGAVVQRQANGTPVLQGLDYDVTGMLTEVLFDTGERQATDLDKFKRPRGFAYLDVQGSPLWGKGSYQNSQAPYTYDGAGNIASVGASPTQIDTFAYDALSRLTAAKVHRRGTDTHQYAYSYDAFGNLTGRSESVPSGFQNSDLKSYLTGQLNLGTTEAENYIKATVFSAIVATTEGVANNRVAAVTRAANTGLVPDQPVLNTMVYDANGNLADDGTYAYGHDALNRQVSVTEVSTGERLAEYVYLASGERIATLKYTGEALADYTRYFRDGAAVLWEKTDATNREKCYLYAGGRMAYTQESWVECAYPMGMSAASLTLGTPTVTALAGSETATAEFTLSLLPAAADAVEVHLVKGNSLVSSQRLERPAIGWPSQERITFAGLLEGADYQAGLTVFSREGQAPRMPPKAYLVERMKLGLVRGKLAAWTAARFREDGNGVREEATTGFASLAPEGTEDYTATAREGAQVHEVARGHQAEEVTLSEQVSTVAVQGTAGSTVALASPALVWGGGAIQPACTRHGARTYYGLDHLGTVRFTKTVHDNGSETTTTHDYEPFGVELPSRDACGNTHQFTGHERDTETGNDYMHFRMFAPNMGRFMRPDSQYDNAEASPQGYNLYTYVKGNPVNFNDPTGHWTDEQLAAKAERATTPSTSSGGAEPTGSTSSNIATPAAGALPHTSPPPSAAASSQGSPTATPPSANQAAAQPTQGTVVNVTGAGSTTINVNGSATININGSGTTTVNVGPTGASVTAPTDNVTSSSKETLLTNAAQLQKAGKALQATGKSGREVAIPTTLTAGLGTMMGQTYLAPVAGGGAVLTATSATVELWGKLVETQGKLIDLGAKKYL